GVAVQEPGVAEADAVGLLEGALPLVVDVLGGVEPRLLLPLEAAVRPRLVRVAGQEEPVRDVEAAVVRRQGVPARVELFRSDHRASLVLSSRSKPRRHSSVRIAHRSGNAGLKSVVLRYSAPVEPPVPGFVPIVRSTILS